MKGKNILYIMHAWVDNNNLSKTSIGGTTLHVMDLINSLKYDNNCFVLTVSSGFYHVYSYIENKVTDYNLGIAADDYMFSKYNDEYKNMLSNLIDKLEIDLVHIHHLLGHYYDCVDVLIEKKVKTIITIHDYFMICPQVNLLYKSISYCDDRTCSKCNRCIKCRDIDFGNRKLKVGELLEYAQKVIVPNNSVSNEFKKVYPNIKYDLIEHGIDLEDNNNYIKKKNKRLNVAFVGVMNYIKGSEVCKKIVTNTNDSNIRFHFFGVSADNFFTTNKKNYTYHGEYSRSDIIKKLRKNNIDIVCLLTVCPETFCYTMSEVLVCKIPIIGFDIGAIGDRIKRYDCGWVIPTKNMANGVISKLRYLEKNRNEIDDKVNNILKLNIVKVSDMVNNTNSLYLELLPQKTIKRQDKYDSIIKETFKKSYKINISKSMIILRKIYRSIKSKIPYFIKRPIYLVVRKIMKRGN